MSVPPGPTPILLVRVRPPLEWIGHVVRMDGEWTTRKLLGGEPWEGRKKEDVDKGGWIISNCTWGMWVWEDVWTEHIEHLLWVKLRPDIEGWKNDKKINQNSLKIMSNYTGCFKKSFTTLKAYRNLYRGHTQRFELSKCSKTHRVLPRIVIRNCYTIPFMHVVL